MSLSEQSIGLFDSGLGGLSVMRAIGQLLPRESIIYFGDTANIPYGTKSYSEIQKYAVKNARFLVDKHGIKLLVVACNSASAVSLDLLQQNLSIPVIGVINAGVRSALSAKARDIAILATHATVKSLIYKNKLKEYGFNGEIIQQACPLFVPLVENQMISGQITTLIAKHYLLPSVVECDTVILGCTHYPLLMPTLKKVLPPQTQIIEPSLQVALEVQSLLSKNNLINKSKNKSVVKYLFTDISQDFDQNIRYYLGGDDENIAVELVRPKE